jgi:DNA polymerase (family 10)
MDSRTAAHTLSQIASYLELNGENSFKCKAYRGAAKGLLALNADDLAPLYRTGELGRVRGLGPATLAVVRDLIEFGESRYLEQLRESTPEGLLEMLDVPGLSPDRIRKIHESLGVQTIEELEEAARNGRLAALPRFGPKTAERVLKGIAFLRSRGSLRLYHHAVVEANQLVAMVRSHPDVARAEIAGTIRRRLEVAGAVDVVAACRRSPTEVAQSFTRIAGVKASDSEDGTVAIRFVDGGHLDLRCVEPDQFGVALWRATGSDEHVAGVRARLSANGYSVDQDWLRGPDDRIVAASDEDVVYRAAGIAYVEPELREGLGEVEAAVRGSLPGLLVPADIRGVLHCHSHYSDGKASIAEMARAARDRGWSYIGISDHSQAAFYANGLSRQQILAQHAEIDELNATFTDFRVLKGIEADILADGQLDYDDTILDRFDYVIGSIHSRFAMNRAAMTERVLKALENPRLTILAHPTGRLLLSRDPYDIDVDAVLERAREVGAAVELNADPHRLDLDWRHLRRAKALRVQVSIGPDAHSTNGLDYMEYGIGIARKAWLEPRDALNSRSAEEVLAFARRRREGAA